MLHSSILAMQIQARPDGISPEQSANGIRLSVVRRLAHQNRVSSRSGRVESSLTGASTRSSIRRTNLTAWAGSPGAGARAEPDQPSIVHTQVAPRPAPPAQPGAADRARRHPVAGADAQFGQAVISQLSVVR